MSKNPIPQQPCTDPPWLDEASLIARNEFYGNIPIGGWIAVPEQVHECWTRVVRAVCAFAARQSQEITEAMVEALHKIMNECDPEDPEWANPIEGRRHCYEIARAALEVAEQTRRNQL